MTEDLNEGTYSEDAYVGHTSLNNLHILLQQIFVPFLSDQDSTSDELQKYNEAIQSVHSLNTDFVSHLKKFSGQVGYTLKQLSGEVLIDLPNIHLDDAKTAAEDDHVSSESSFLMIVLDCWKIGDLFE